jgi:hypothetical protein
MDISGDGTRLLVRTPEADTYNDGRPAEKKWSKTPLPPEQRGKMPDEYEDPAEYIKRFMARPYKELGRSAIDGIEVEGIEVTDPPTKEGKLADGIGRMWVDVQTELPVRIEIEGTADGKTVRWLWNLMVRGGARFRLRAQHPQRLHASPSSMGITSPQESFIESPP